MSASNTVWKTCAAVATILSCAGRQDGVARLHPAHGRSELRDQSCARTAKAPVNLNRTSPPTVAASLVVALHPSGAAHTFKDRIAPIKPIRGNTGMMFAVEVFT